MFLKKEEKNLLELIRNGNKITRMQQLELVAALSFPAIIAQISSVIMQYIDASMVGRLGATQSASIGLVSTTTWLFGSIGSSFSMGFSVQVAQNIGAEKYENARKVVRQGLVSILGLTILIGLIGILISGQLPMWLKGNESLRKDATDYFFVYAVSLPMLGLNCLAGSMLQCSGNMKIPGFLNVFMCFLDVVLNAFFIFPNRIVKIASYKIEMIGMNLGVKGAALGTACAEAIVAFIMLYFLCVRSKELHINRKESFRPTMACQKKAIRIALPIAFEHFVVCGAMIVSTRIVAPIGTVALAANSFAITAESLCYMPGYGIADAATTLVGQSVGAKRKELIRHFARMTTFVGIFVMTLTGIIMYVEAPFMISLLTSDIRVQSLGVKVLRIEAFAEPMYAASIVAAGALRGASDTLIPSVLNFISLWCVRIPLSLLLVGKYGLVGIWIAMSMELIFRGIIFMIRLYREKWMIEK